MLRVNYDEVASTYDTRYAQGAPDELIAFVHGMCLRNAIGRALEVGCGTGHWLNELLRHCSHVTAVDVSAAMLHRARESSSAALIRGRAEALPLRDGCVDLVVCINAVHHFERPLAYIPEAWRVLGAGGKLAIVALAPHDGLDRWYQYDHFDGTRDADRRRYPRTADLASWMQNAGFGNVDVDVVARIQRTYLGPRVFGDPVLSRHGTSQLSLLTDDAFEQGMRSICAAIDSAAEGTTPTFAVDLRLFGTIGDKPWQTS